MKLKFLLTPFLLASICASGYAEKKIDIKDTPPPPSHKPRAPAKRNVEAWLEGSVMTIIFTTSEGDASLSYGGLPYLVNLPLRSTWNEYISGVTDAVVYRDIVSRHSLRNNDFLQRLLLFMADNIGQLFTAKKIADYLKSQRVSSSVGSVMAYVGYIEEAFIVNKSRRWEIEGKRFFEIGEKYFFEDLGIRNSIVGFRPHDISGLMENAVYNHLRISGYEVKTGIMAGGREIDFVAEKDGEIIYVQVAMTVADKATADREYGNLAMISDNYEKIVVTYRDSFPNTVDGIKTMSLREFLNR